MVEWRNPNQLSATRVLGTNVNTWQQIVCKKQITVGDSAKAAFVRLFAGNGVAINSYFNFTDVALYER